MFVTETKRIKMQKVVQTTEKTFNKKVKSLVSDLMPNAVKCKKKHVAGVGYVFFVKDSRNNTLGKVFKEFQKGMKIYVD